MTPPPVNLPPPRADVQAFLNALHAKMRLREALLRVPVVLFEDDRGKNEQTLFTLELPGTERLQYLYDLTPADFSHCLSPDQPAQGDLFVFGVLARHPTRKKKKPPGPELYIKIQLGCDAEAPICVSFHVAEFPIQPYPYRLAPND